MAPVGLVDLLKHSLANTSVTANIPEAPVRQPGPVSCRPQAGLPPGLLPVAMGTKSLDEAVISQAGC